MLRATHRASRAEVAVKVMSLSTTRIVDDEVRRLNAEAARRSLHAQASALAPTTLTAAPSLRFGAARVAAEEDVMKEVHLLRHIDQCAPSRALKHRGGLRLTGGLAAALRS